jgi:predicted permease
VKNLLRILFRRDQLEADMSEEIRAHLEEQTRRNLAAGMCEAEARAAAHCQFGGVAQIQERARDVFLVRWLADLAQDLRYGMRALRRNPGFTATAMLTLALGIGANASVFSVMQRLLLAPLPIHEPQTLVVVERHNRATGGSTTFSYGFFEELARDHELLAAALCRATGVERVTVEIESGGVPARGELVSGNYFDVLGIRPFRGRLFTAEDDRTPGAHPVVVLSHAFWQRQFGGDSAIIGKSVRLTGQPMTVVGVTPPEFNGLDPDQAIDIRVPLAMQAELRGGRASPNQPRNPTGLQIVARLQRTGDLDRAATRLTARFRRFLDQHEPATAAERAVRESEHITLRSAAAGYGQARQRFAPTLGVLIAITTAVLLVACLNLGSLLLARASTRQREFALRLALGADRGRVVRQLLVEGMLLAGGGAIVGTFLCIPGSALLLRVLMVDGFSGLAHGPDMVVIVALAATAVICGILFGLAPAWSLRGRAPAMGLKGDHRVAGPARGRAVLVVAQVAAAVVVLTGAGLFLRTVHALRSTHPGFDVEHLLLAAVSPKNAGRTDAEALAFFREARERIEALPGVVGASYSMVRAMAGNVAPTAIVGEGLFEPADARPPVRNVVGPAYFQTFGQPLLAGRDFLPSDTTTAPKVAIVNQRFAELYFPGQAALGRKIGVASPEFTIVGVASDARHTHIREPAAPTWYIPYEQFAATKYLDFCVRTTGEPEAMLGTIRATISALDPAVALFEVRTQRLQLDQLLVTERTLAQLAAFFGVIAAALSAVGLYGLLAFVVHQQRREIGIRLALGAAPGRVLRGVVRQGLRLTGIGLFVGGLIALLATRAIAHLLYGIAPHDPGVLAAVALVVSLVASLACFLPASRAARVDPITALRAE